MPQLYLIELWCQRLIVIVLAKRVPVRSNELGRGKSLQISGSKRLSLIARLLVHLDLQRGPTNRLHSVVELDPAHRFSQQQFITVVLVMVMMVTLDDAVVGWMKSRVLLLLLWSLLLLLWSLLLLLFVLLVQESFGTEQGELMVRLGVGEEEEGTEGHEQYGCSRQECGPLHFYLGVVFVFVLFLLNKIVFFFFRDRCHAAKLDQFGESGFPELHDT